jgi:PEP-CTERM putative exosortase interaction domain
MGQLLLYAPEKDSITGAIAPGSSYFDGAGSIIVVFLYDKNVYGDSAFFQALSDGTYATAYSSLLLGEGVASYGGAVGSVSDDDRLSKTPTDFFMVALYDSGTSDGYWFNISSKITATPYLEGQSPPETTTSASFSNSTATMGGWQAVPEPATAALALAGLALLIRRRK